MLSCNQFPLPESQKDKKTEVNSLYLSPELNFLAAHRAGLLCKASEYDCKAMQTEKTLASLLASGVAHN